MSGEQFFDRLYDLHESSDVRRHYDRFAQSYDAALTGNGYAQPDRVAEAVVAAGVVPDARILDAGCGTGLSGRALADRGFTNLHGCDYSPEMLARAHATGVYRSLHEVDLNATSVEVPGAPFDAVTAVGILGHGHVDGEAVPRLIGLLRPSGLFATAINAMAWPDGDAKPVLDRLVDDATVLPYSAEIGDHIPGLDSQGWVITTRRC